MTLVLGGIPCLGVNMRKRKIEPIGRCSINWIFLPSGQALLCFVSYKILTIKLVVSTHAYNERFDWEQTHIQIHF